MLNPVVQQDDTGCAIASVAAIAGVSYQQAKKVARALGIDSADGTLWSDTAPMRRLLAKFDIAAAPSKIPFRSWTALPDLALLATKWHTNKERAFWHWVVFVRADGRAYVLDSKASLRTPLRTDFGRIKPKWYIRVEDQKNQKESAGP